MRVLGGIAFALLLLAATWWLRAPGLAKPVWNVDEAVTFTMAEQIRAGQVPYRDAVDQRTPLAPYAQAAVSALAGPWNLRAQHAVLALLIGLTAVLVWRLGAQLGEPAAGAAGALWFTLLAFLVPSVRDTMPAHTAWYLVLASTAGFLLLARAWASGRAAWGLAAGAAFGLAALAKQPGVLDGAAAGALLLLAAALAPARRAWAARTATALAAGGAAPLLATGAYFAAQGAWSDFAYYAWTYNRVLYVPEVAAPDRWRTVTVPFALTWEYQPLAVLFATAAALALLARAVRRARAADARCDFAAWLALGWTGAGLYATTLSGRGFTHYSIQLLPGLALVAGTLTAALARAAAAGRGPAHRLAAAATLAVLAAALLWPVPARRRALDLPEPGTDAVTALIRRQTGPADRLFIWGYNPEFYALSERLPATRFLYCTFVTGLIPWTNLDPLRPTDYAVVPGARAALLADWARHPPTLILDGKSQRGFLKYPLEHQAWLWPLIERDYVEVECDAAAPLGFWMFRRAEAGPLPALPAAPVETDAIQVLPGPVRAGESVRVAVRAPADVTWLALELDGRIHRRVAQPARALAAVAFRVPAAEWEGAPRRVRVLAGVNGGVLASRTLTLAAASAAAGPGGPPLRLGDATVAALESRTMAGDAIRPKPEAPDHWDAHAPSRLVYPRQPGMNSLTFAWGLEEQALAKEPPNHTDGVEVVVQIEEDDGRVTPVYQRYVNRDDARRTRGHLVDHTPLPPGTGGRLVLLLTPGPRFDPAFDWSYWLWLRTDPAPVALVAGGHTRYPAALESAAPPRLEEFNQRLVSVVGAPAQLEFAAGPDLAAVSGVLGLLDTAWTGPDACGPVTFTVTLERPDGTSQVLLERELDPAHRAEDRGARPFAAAIPAPASGRLRFRTAATARPAMAHAFWGGLTAATLDLALPGPGGPQPLDERSQARFGLSAIEVGGRPALFAHAPADLAYAVRDHWRRLRGEFGVVDGAYTGGQATDGVVFVVECEDAHGARRELWRRHLDPANQVGDRGPQGLDLALPALPGGRVWLRTLAAPSGRLNNAWSYWRGVHAEE